MISFEFLQLLIYFVLLFSIVAYATLDGYDLGVGCLHLFTKGDNERRLMINSIGPVWDGNTTWIVVGGGVLFAGFPKIFASLTSSLYTPTMMLLFGFMLRAASIEFRSKSENITWRKFWDTSFSLASLLLAVLVGLILGNLITGLPLNQLGEYEGGLANLLKPYTILVALFGLSMFMMHGSLYLLMKTENAFHDKIRNWCKILVVIFLIMWAVTTVSTWSIHSHMIKPFFNYPILNIIPLISLISVGSILHCIRKHKDGWAFTFSCMAIFFFMILFVIGTFPNIVYSSNSPENSLTLYNSSASRTALLVLAIVGLTGIPLGYFYGSYVHKVFKGKVKLDHMSY